MPWCGVGHKKRPIAWAWCGADRGGARRGRGRGAARIVVGVFFLLGKKKKKSLGTQCTKAFVLFCFVLCFMLYALRLAMAFSITFIAFSSPALVTPSAAAVLFSSSVILI